MLGLAFLAAGLFPLAISLGWFAVPAQSVHAPLSMVGCAGVSLSAAGLATLLPEHFARLRGFLGGLAVTALAVIADWIAFGVGERGLGDTLSLGAVMDSSPSRENAGRAVLALFAVLISLLALWGWVQWLRELRKP
jgi:hypothetical protein